MKSIVELNCESRHCGSCHVVEDVCFDDYSGAHCYLYKANLRETGRGVLRCKPCMEAEQAYKKLESLKTCDNCKTGPAHSCEKIKNCERGWGDSVDLWESVK